jgi:anaerobic magnesium-protoporphyrin IX monomethyl ester cyclase
MKILALVPPHVPSYFNAGHRLALFEVAGYLRRQGHRVDAVDAAALNAGWRDLCHLLQPGYDLVALFNDFDAVDTFARTLAYVRALSPGARTVTFGRLSKSVPGFFRQFDLDAVIASGDSEAGVAGFARHLESGGPTPGVDRREGGAWVDGGPGELLPTGAWVLPDVEDIPYDAYRRMYANDLHKYCGIPGRMELVVPVARGCPIGCAFCDVPTLQGKKERRIPVERAMAYIDDCFERLPFEYLSFYAPTFTLHRAWVRELCAAMRAARRPYRWKCTSTLVHVDEALLEAMAAAGCVRVSVGLETLDPGALGGLPRCKRDAEARLKEVAAVCRRVGIELNCFVIAGLPGDGVDGVAHTIRTVLGEGARVRPTVYAPYHLMRDDMTVEEIARFNRQLFVDDDPGHAAGQPYYALLFQNEYDRATTVMEEIAVRG